MTLGLHCRERDDKFAPFRVQAKKERKTLDFECALTEDNHKVNMAALMAQRDPSRWAGDFYIDYEAKVNLFMAVPGVRADRPAAWLLFTFSGTICETGYVLPLQFNV